MENGDNYSTAPWRSMRRSVCGNMVQWVNLQNERRASSSYNHDFCYVISPAVARYLQSVVPGFVPEPPIFSKNDWFCTRTSNFFQSPIFSIASPCPYPTFQRRSEDPLLLVPLVPRLQLFPTCPIWLYHLSFANSLFSKKNLRFSVSFHFSKNTFELKILFKVLSCWKRYKWQPNFR